MKRSQLLNPKFKQFINNLIKQPLPIKCAVKLERTVEQIDDAIKDYESSRVKALTALGSKDANNAILHDGQGNITLTEENKKKFTEEMSAILNTVVLFEDFSVEEFGPDFKISVEELVLLKPLLK